VIPSIFLQFQLRPQLSAQLPPHAQPRQRRIQRKVTGGRHGAGAILAEQKKTLLVEENSEKNWEKSGNVRKTLGKSRKPWKMMRTS
jgi:hypothetical protein